jgi:hypothetical protein
MAMDAVVTGDALWSFHYTEQASEQLYGQYSRAENLGQGWQDFVACAGLMAIAVAPGAAARRTGLAPTGLRLVAALLGLTAGVFLALVVSGMASNERYLLLPSCLIAVLAGVAASPTRSPRVPVRGLVVLATAALMLQVITRVEPVRELPGRLATAVTRMDDTRSLVATPVVDRLLSTCAEVGVSRKLLHGWSWYSGRPPSRWTLDEDGRSRPDVYVAPATRAAAEDLLTRRRFDSDGGFKLPPGLRPGPSRGDWRIYLDPSAPCVAAAPDGP